MSTSVEALNNLPEIDFVAKDVDTLLTNMIAEYQDAYLSSTGESKTLASGDPIRIWIYAQALRIYTAYQLIDQAAKFNLLKYSSGDYLENLGARIGVTRNVASAATVTQKFSLAQAQIAAVAIPKGTRVSTGGNVFFATTEDAEIITAENNWVEVIAECTETGTIGNGYTADQITTLVDPIQYISSTSNTDKSQGGTDGEDDDSLRERIFTKPESFSVAGTTGAYEYFTKECNSSIADVSVTSPNPGEVLIHFILEDGELPEQPLIDTVQEYLSADSRRPLTDSVSVAKPGTVSFSVNIDYYIKKSDKNSASTIEAAVNTAVTEYITWQKSKIGRDINPSKLITMVMNAGASRVIVNSPVYTTIGNTEVAIAVGEATIIAHDKPEELEDE